MYTTLTMLRACTVAIVASALAVLGCGRASDVPEIPQVVVLTSQGLTVGSRQIELLPPKPLNIRGRRTAICYVLQGNVGSISTKEMESRVKAMLDGANITTSAVTAKGVVHFRRPTAAWDKDGKILAGGELAACAFAPCDNSLTIGDSVSKVLVESDLPRLVKGVYWESAREPGELTPNATTRASANLNVACSS